jgi:hypothetical protein
MLSPHETAQMQRFPKTYAMHGKRGPGECCALAG